MPSAGRGWLHHARMLARPAIESLLPGEQRMNAKLQEMGKAATV